MNFLRRSVPILCFIALVAVFLKLPEVANTFKFLKCKSCTIDDPYITLVAAGYFALILVASLLFPQFPNRFIAKAGLIWAVLLAFVLTYLNLPTVCPSCLLAHLCNILIWLNWSLDQSGQIKSSSTPLREKIFLLVFAPMAMIALFSCINLTLLAYGIPLNQRLLELGLQPGNAVPTYAAKTSKGDAFHLNPDKLEKKLILNFVAPNCPYCKEQIPILNSMTEQLQNKGYRIVNITPALSDDQIVTAPLLEWMEDDEGKLRGLFRVAGFPTLFVIDLKGKVNKVIPGLPTDLQESLKKLKSEPISN